MDFWEEEEKDENRNNYDYKNRWNNLKQEEVIKHHKIRKVYF